MNRSNRQRAIARRNLFVFLCVFVLILVMVFATFIISALFRSDESKEDDTSSEILTSETSSTQNTASKEDESSKENASSKEDNSSKENTSSKEDVSEEEKTESGDVTMGEHNLDANYSNLLLVNSANPLPEDYDYEGNLVTVEEKYINGSLRQVNKDVWPYMKAMIEKAWADGVKLYIWSPYRSYDTQKMLFENKVGRVTAATGLTGEAAEKEAATVVARPGTSEHHTGLATDFNMANSGFEKTEMFKWMQENAENYGFIMRYSEEKQPLTGVIHESWHWRFVGINAAKEINKLDMCLEEYLEYKGVEITPIENNNETE